MKVWMLTVSQGKHSESWLCFTQEEADEEARSSVEEACETWDIEVTEEKTTAELASQLQDETNFYYDIVEHDLNHHHAVKTAIAALEMCQGRLEINDCEGEEAPFMKEVETALEVLRG